MASRVIHFEIQADNLERAAKFYEDVFGWSFQKWAGPMEYWLATTGPDGEPGINGGLMKKGAAPTTGTINTLSVSSVDEFLGKIGKHGGKTVTPKTPIPGVGYFAYCSDPEGNVFGIMQADANAK